MVYVVPVPRAHHRPAADAAAGRLVSAFVAVLGSCSWLAVALVAIVGWLSIGVASRGVRIELSNVHANGQPAACFWMLLPCGAVGPLFGVCAGWMHFWVLLSWF